MFRSLAIKGSQINLIIKYHSISVKMGISQGHMTNAIEDTGIWVLIYYSQKVSKLTQQFTMYFPQNLEIELPHDPGTTPLVVHPQLVR